MRGAVRLGKRYSQGQAAPIATNRGFAYIFVMRVVLKTNNPVVLSYATHVLEESGITALVFDTHASIMDGSMAMVPRRLMVEDEDFIRGERLLRAAVPEAMP